MKIKTVINVCLYSLLTTFSGCTILGSDDASFGYREDVLFQINLVRSQPHNCGGEIKPAVPPVRWNDTLAEAALNHSEDLLKNGLAGHIGSDGSTPGKRILETGYKYQAFGEIVAVGSESLDKVMEGWLHSPGHCSVIMNPAFEEAGAATAGLVWTVDFGSRSQ